MNYKSLLLLTLTLLPAVCYGQFVLHGTVSEASNQMAIPYVKVLIAGTDVGTVTDMHGAFTLSSKTSAAELSFSFI
jgi:hypothetical protein